MKAIPCALVLLAGAALPLATLAASATPIPIATFFKKSATTGAILSPNGRFVAVRKLSPEGRTMLAVVDVMGLTSKSVANFGKAGRDRAVRLERVGNASGRGFRQLMTTLKAPRRIACCAC